MMFTASPAPPFKRGPKRHEVQNLRKPISLRGTEIRAYAVSVGHPHAIHLAPDYLECNRKAFGFSCQPVMALEKGQYHYHAVLAKMEIGWKD
jgi:hypothetical protein